MGQVFSCKQCCGPLDSQDALEDLYNEFIQRNIKKSQLITQQNYQIAFQDLKKNNTYLCIDSNRGVLFKRNFGYYQGQISENLSANGQGRLVFTNQNQYRGHFKNGKFQGKGTLIDKKNLISFQGSWQNGLPKQGQMNIQGRKIKFQNIKPKEGGKVWAKVTINNLIYEGELLQVKRNNMIRLVFQGQGTMHFPDESSYKGQWHDSKMQGYGQYTWKNGNKYEGNYKNGVRMGKGKMYWKDTNPYQVYDGFWKNGRPIQQSKIKLTHYQDQRNHQNQP